MSNRKDKRKQEMDKNPLYPYSTPEGYFEDFKSRLMSKIQEEEMLLEPLEQRKKPILEVLRPYLYLAAMFVGLALLINFFPTVTKQSEDFTQPVSLTAEQVTIDVTEEEFEQFLLDDTAEEYWGTILLESRDNSNVMGAR